jgi:stage II sporulation protein D
MSRTLVCLLAVLPLSAASPNIRVQLRTDRGVKIVEMPLERYVTAAIAGESSVFQSSEALKAMAVAARTYAVRLRGRHSAEGFDLCDTTHCQRLDVNAVTPRLEAAATATAGEMLWYEGKPAFTPYTRDCGGRTEDAADVWPDLAAPYLKSHSDEYCTRSGSSAWQWNADPRKVLDALQRSGLRGPHELDGVSILNRTASGRASLLLLAGRGESIRISAGSFRFAMGRELGWNTLRSDRYEVRSSNGRLQFEGSGSGHGVGLCQLGAEQMGLLGRSYREILAYYYPGTLVGLTGRGLSWQRLGGDSISMLTTEPELDRLVLATAERLIKRSAERTKWPVPPNIEIRVYPDLDTFRDATGEPGWVAAHTVGRRVHLQPVALLRSKGALEPTLSHELIHVSLEAQAASGLPLWFREGLVNFLVSGRGAGVVRIPSDAELRQTADSVRARQAYADATAYVGSLVQRYGEGAVLDWVKRGLPPEVTKASTNQATTKSK